MKRALIAAAGVVAGLTGCSTARNLIPSDVHDTPPWKIYGGVSAASDNLYAESKGGAALVWPLVLVDLAASAVADTFTLPLTCIAQLNGGIRDYYFPKVPPAAVPIEAVPAEPVAPAAEAP